MITSYQDYKELRFIKACHRLRTWKKDLERMTDLKKKDS